MFPRSNSIGWELRIMKSMSLVRIPAPLVLCGHVKKKEEVFEMLFVTIIATRKPYIKFWLFLTYFLLTIVNEIFAFEKFWLI
jgi:hypothetical protein